MHLLILQLQVLIHHVQDIGNFVLHDTTRYSISLYFVSYLFF
jgi:hypothetical protein